VLVDGENYLVRSVDPGIFNHAHPDLVLDELTPGTRITVEGLSEKDFVVAVPEEPTEVEVRIGDRARVVAAPIDGVFIWTEERKVVVTQRARFDYVFRREELRQAVVLSRRG
jgi:hypothetical protein